MARIPPTTSASMKTAVMIRTIHSRFDWAARSRGRLRGATIRGRVANRTWGRVYVRRKGSKSKIHPPGSIVLVRADGSFHVSSPHWPAVYELRWQDPDAYDPSKGPDAVVDASAGGELRVTIGSK